MAAQVLKGKKVSELPVEFYNTTTPVANKDTAKLLGITIPDKYKEVAVEKK